MVLENRPPGTLVLRVQAYDADMGVNGEVKYGIMHRDGVSSGFDIDPETGKFDCAVRYKQNQADNKLTETVTVGYTSVG